MKNKKNQKFVKLVVLSILIVFLTTSANSAMINNNATKVEDSSPPVAPLSQNYYEWIDEFGNEQLIDSGQSYNYMVEGGVAKMIDTFEIWTDGAWLRMMPIDVDSNSNYNNLAVNFHVTYDSDMESDFRDVRFKHEDYPDFFLSYWMEDFEPSSWAEFWVLVPHMDSGQNWMYMFYKNSQATYQGNFGDVFSDWEEQWANDKEITTLKYPEEGCWDPDVNYNQDDDEFIVCWEQGMPYWLPYLPGFKQEIKASVFEPDGDMLVSEKIVYKDPGASYWRNENPSIAYGKNGKWFVAWDHYAPENNPASTTLDIYATTIERSGSSLSMGTTRIVTDDPDCDGTIQADANVAYDSENEKFLVVWEDGRDGVGDYDIWARLYTSSGGTSGDEKRLNNDANSQCEPWIAYDPGNEQYMIVWEDGIHAADGPFRIRGGLFDSSMNTITTFTVDEPSGWPNQNLDYNFPCVCFDEDSERFLVTWNEADISDGVYRGDVLGKIYDTSGNVEVSTFTIRTGSFERTSIVPYLSEAFFVTYDNEVNVFGRLVTADGDVLGGDVQVSASAGAEADWNNIATDGSKIFSAWEDKRIEYLPARYDFMPDVFGNMVYLNIPSGNEITYTFGDEKQFISTAQVTSIVIEPDNLEKWHEFLEDHTLTISFDILDETGNIIILEDISSGHDLSTINPNQYPAIRLRAHFSRNNPTYTPTLSEWSILYEGIDLEPPVTTVNNVDGQFAPNQNWYKSEQVIVWLDAIDYPLDTGSGVDQTYYTLNSGPTNIYNDASGIQDIIAEDPNWWAIFELNFWSVDNEGNIEDRTKQQNYRTIQIDARPPVCVITSPENEEKVSTPFDVIAEATDNYKVEYVEFDIEPFGKRPGLPWKDTTPPWIWTCNEGPMGGSRPLTFDPENDPPQPKGSNAMVRADAYDTSLQNGWDENWVYIENWHSRPRTISIFRNILERIKLGIVIDSTLEIEIPIPTNADSVELEARRIFSGKTTIIKDNDLSDGCSGSFDIPTGLYKISFISYSEGEVINRDMVIRILYINR